ncbi:alkaline phosphatase D family protein [uncultured Jannaschia sp.]|uniref:alkaline phosphatase D family protein n=1 Tax=uncultured Jannaschia sp. TaxID=293347 RepID=UPI0034195444
MLDEIAGGEMRLSALFVGAQGEVPPPVDPGGREVPASILLRCGTRTLWRARFAMPAHVPSSYSWNGDRYDLAGLGEDLRLAFVSCNGEETGDLDREGSERNAMWARLAGRHKAAPFALLLHGGDQIYADEATEGHPLSAGWPDGIPQDPSHTDLEDLRRHLRVAFFARYAAVYSAPETAWLCARVPSLMQWDDHDICDGWGSLRRSRTEGPVGRTIFKVAREMALGFQHGARDGDLPARFADPKGAHLGWWVEAPGLRLLAPDLRSERTRRQIMGAGGWSMIDAAVGFRGRTLLMSSVPLLGPRLSLLEGAMRLHPRMMRYEDDLRDQWQSRAHRTEWRRMLSRLRDAMAGQADDASGITVLSGEIHLAARATMALGGGRILHQLTASGISHRAPPQGWARFLGLLSRLGDAPLAGCPIRMRRLPGQRALFVAERNFLVLSRRSNAWTAEWDLERSGRAGPLTI